MMAYPNRDLTLAMAGMLQSAALVQQLARRENWEDTALHDITFSFDSSERRHSRKNLW